MHYRGQRAPDVEIDFANFTVTNISPYFGNPPYRAAISSELIQWRDGGGGNWTLNRITGQLDWWPGGRPMPARSGACRKAEGRKID